ncbi:MAG: DEAD/DEAH box helicase family protein [Deltaproteobacteria bacterium]|nr:DEAD/DEAH box helicase family protein [Deltaproteobacteria bacterium]
MSSSKPDITRLLDRVEFHSNSIALLPASSDKNPGVAFYIKNENTPSGKIFCSCMLQKEGACAHMQELKEISNALIKESFDTLFRSGAWYRVASVLAEGNSTPVRQISLKKVRQKSRDIIVVTDAKNNELLRYFSSESDTLRFIERCIGRPQTMEGDTSPARNLVLSNLYHQSMSKSAWLMIERGFRTRGQMLEESFWFRIAYHAFREVGNDSFTLSPAVNVKSGWFTVTCNNRYGTPVFRINVPSKTVRMCLLTFKDLLLNQHGLPVNPVPLKSIFNVTDETELDLDVRPFIKQIQKQGESRFLKGKAIERFKYDGLVYLPEPGIIAELEMPGKERIFRAPVKMALKKSVLPWFKDKDECETTQSYTILTKEIKPATILKEYERIDLTPEAIDKNFCSISIKYRFGNSDLSLNNILRAVKNGERYIVTDSGWVDTRSPEIGAIADCFKGTDPDTGSEVLRLTRKGLLRFKTSSRNLNVIGNNSKVGDLLKNILALKPSRPVPVPAGLRSSLREYQKLGAEWLFYLYENFFGGLLCDDMGLGKTHQVMAFLLALKEQQDICGPFLVVCPMTVLSHWQAKIREHAPSLKETVYHGGARDLEEAIKTGNLILTSYGILTRDIEKLTEIYFPVIVFDEIQHIKNSETKAHRAARQINAGIKVGLTGTPIENRLEELKVLLDLTVPGYLGSDTDFYLRYIRAIQEQGKKERKEELARVVSPFILRRLKTSVLKELPEKIEDVLRCTLSKEQVLLYRNAVELKGAGLIDTLKNGRASVPYIHIFALLNLLKQICNHPALIEKSPEKYERYESGKWELFKEILNEGIESGQKVVVYSQYLDMINIIERYLAKQGTGFVSLTGKSRNRGDIIKKFSDDPDCRVFIGSLKAGGVGIDLIAASVVIHYDRWWNAAKEDQATDRVHRIGQKRGVQVFKLVTEGTLEEKISAIISRKKDLMDSIIKEDDPGLLKGFSREELMELIRF